MYRLLAVLSIIVLLSGCHKQQQAASFVSDGQEAKGSAPTEAGYAGKAKLAYSHDLGLEMPAESIKSRYERARDYCLNDAQMNCTVMGSYFDMGDPAHGVYPSASLTVRVPHQFVKPFEDSLLVPVAGEKPGEAVLRNHSMSAEDLTKALLDAGQRQKQLTDYRDRLTALAKRADAKVEDLVKIESELSTVQSQLESLEAEMKGLNERVDTEKLSVSFRSDPDLGNSLGPIVQAWREGGQVLGSSAADALRFAISSLPWLPIVVIGLLIVRVTFRRWRRPT